MKIKNELSEETLIAPCGMNCGICLAFLREKKSCRGCRRPDDNKPGHCVSCVIKNCESLKTTDSKFCYDCEKYPCTRLKQLDKRYRTKYRMSMIENLNSIKSDGLECFELNELERWACPDCGGTICVHRGYCLKCN